jgi:hypothetical protein
MPPSTLGGLSMIQKMGVALRQKVKDLVIEDLTKVSRGDGNIQESTVQRLKEYLFKTRQPLEFNLCDIIKITIRTLFSPITGVFKSGITPEVLKKNKKDKVLLF